MCFSMDDCIKDNNCRQTFYDDDSNDLIVVEKQSKVLNSRKIFSHPVVSYDDSNEETTFNEQEFVPPDTLFLLKTRLVISLGIINSLSLAMLALLPPEKMVDGVAVLFNLTTSLLSIAMIL